MLRYKENYFYLILFSIFLYSGMYFSEIYSSLNGLNTLFKIIPHVLLTINSFYIYRLSLEYSQDKLISFFAGLLYLASPLHLDLFLHPFQLQFILAETALYAGIYYSVLKNNWKTVIAFICATLLNASLLSLVPFLLYSKRINFKQKILLLINSSVILLYTFSAYFTQGFLVTDSLKTFFYIIESLIFPFNISLLNLAVINPDYFSRFFIVAILVVFVYLWWIFKDHENERHSFYKGLICAALLASIIPTNSIFKGNEQWYYFLPSSYPLLIQVFLVSFLFAWKKFQKFKIWKVVFCVYGLLWIGNNLFLQSNLQTPVEAWKYSFLRLPKDYNYEKYIKAHFLYMLIDHKKYEEAKNLINEAKEKFPNQDWYKIPFKESN